MDKIEYFKSVDVKWKLEITKVTKSEQNMIVDVMDKDYSIEKCVEKDVE